MLSHTISFQGILHLQLAIVHSYSIPPNYPSNVVPNILNVAVFVRVSVRTRQFIILESKSKPDQSGTFQLFIFIFIYFNFNLGRTKECGWLVFYFQGPNYESWLLTLFDARKRETCQATVKLKHDNYFTYS